MCSQKTVDVVVEFASPLLSLYEMKAGVLANLSETAMRIERDKFRQLLSTILCYNDVSARCHDKYLIVDYRGLGPIALLLHVSITDCVIAIT